MKLWTLIENTAPPELERQHGMSLLLELEGEKLLFDFGQSDAFLRNAERLGLHPEKVRAAVLSHGHFDHGGGIAAFLERAPHVDIYVNKNAFGSHHRADGSYIGLDPQLQGHPRVKETWEDLELWPGVHLVQCGLPPASSQGLARLENGQLLPEDFRHEQYLLLREGERRILLSGCTHRGAAVLLEYFRPDVLIGGLHCRHLDPEGPELEELAAVLEKSGARILTCHCTGLAQYEALKKRLGDRIQYIGTGSCVEI